MPDTFFVNEKIALFHQATTENQFLRIKYTGEILRSMRLTIKAASTDMEKCDVHPDDVVTRTPVAISVDAWSLRRPVPWTWPTSPLTSRCAQWK